MLQFRNTDYSIQALFRENFALRKIDTIGWRDALNRETELIRSKMIEARQNGTSTARIFEDFEPVKNIIAINIITTAEQIDKIGWKAFVPGRYADTVTRYYTIPDSLRTNMPKVVDACIDIILKSKNIR